MTKQISKKTKSHTKPVKKAQAPGKNQATKTAGHKATSKSAKSAKPAAIVHGAGGEAKKQAPINHIEESPRLLRENKTTTAALNVLEKAIKLIYHKELKKARAELKMLFDNYPNESEILARARTYVQICDREEVAHKKPVIANDQLYTLGVMEHNRGNFDKAIGYFKQHIEKNPNSDHIYYSLAASFALKGDASEAVKHLQKAVELNEENRVYAKNDSDFSSLHGKKEFSDLVGWYQPPAAG